MPLERPLISIIMPCYNASNTLSQAILSLLKQTYPFFELIAIDDGSKDNTKEILLNWAKKDSRIHPFFLPHRGIVHALNFGLYVSKGKYIVRMDSDDIANKRRLELQMEFLEKNPDIHLVGTQVVYVGKRKGFKNYVHWQNSLITSSDIKKYVFLETPIAHPTFMFRKKIIDEVGGYADGPFPEDYEFLLRLIDKGYNVYKIPKKLLIWRDFSTRVSRTSYSWSKEGFGYIKSIYLSKFILKKVKKQKKIGVLSFGKGAKTLIHGLKKNHISIDFIFVLNKADLKSYDSISICSIDELPRPGDIFLLVFGGSIEKAKKIEKFLLDKGYKPLDDFLLCG